MISDKANEMLRHLGHDMEQGVGCRLFTLLAIDVQQRTMQRVYSSHPEQYPLGGSKNLDTDVDEHWVSEQIEHLRAVSGSSMEDVRNTFRDHEAIRSLGCGAFLNVPVIVGRRCVGSVAVLAPENRLTEPEVQWAVSRIGRDMAELENELKEMNQK